ncbi:AlpA family transcriptional regulator [Candidatus Pseudothioglobus singularis]|nr:AlpA family transcriptional regulator [Candidatus Pseudothioglobus singularis]
MSNSKILKVKQVAEEINVSVPQVYKLVSLGRFPKPIKLGERGSGWLRTEIDAWLQSRVEARDEEVANV